MARGTHKAAKLTGLIVAIVVIAALVIAVGSLCTCLCTCGTCGSRSFICGRRQTEASLVTASAPIERTTETSPAPTPVRTAVPTSAPTPTPIPTPTPTPTPSPTPTIYLIIDEPVEPAPTQTPTPQHIVRPKQVQLRNDGTDTVTVLVLMNGSDLESKHHEATDDLSEMIAAKKNDRVNILIETVGTKSWSPRYAIASDRSQRYRVTDRGLALVDDSLGQLDTTIPATLSDFIRWGAENYPADRYILLFWNHGGGPVYGFGYDEYQTYSSTLTIDEMQIALRDGGVFFDLIGMDCCLMSSLEVAFALYDHCDYTLLSEDFEPGCGWAHTEWLTALAEDPAISTPELAKTVIDNSVTVCETERKNSSMTLALIDESYVKLLFPAWLEFAYANEQTLLSKNYGQLHESTGRAHPCVARAVGGWGFSDGYTLSDYCITDLLSLAANIPSAKSDLLRATYDTTVLYYRATTNERTLAGLSVTLPYGDAAFYKTLQRVFQNAGLDRDYIAWLKKFVDVETADDYFDFSDWDAWADYISQHDWGDWVNTLWDIGAIAADWLDEWVGDDFDDFFDWLFSE